MNRTFTGLVAASIMCAASVYASAPANAQRANFTGFYGGGHVAKGTTTATPQQTTIPTLEPSGAFYGVQIGYDHEFANGIVLGVQGETSFGSPSATVFDGLHLSYGGESKQFSAVTARLGYDINGFLPYVKAGPAWLKATASNHCDVTPFGACGFTGQYDVYDTQTASGWVFGGGLEVALQKGWSVFGEYEQANFGTQSNHFTIPKVGVVEGKSEVDHKVVKVGLNYRF